MPKFTPISVHDLGDYLREQRQSAQLSLRQLSEVAGISNPYISQIERGLKRPSAEILQALAKGLRISAETLYIKAGMLDVRTDVDESSPMDVTDAILADPQLNDRQRAVLLDVYESFLGEPAAGRAPRKPSVPTQGSVSTHDPVPTQDSVLMKDPVPTKDSVPTKPSVATKASDPTKARRARVAKVTKPGLAQPADQKPVPEQT